MDSFVRREGSGSSHKKPAQQNFLQKAQEAVVERRKEVRLAEKQPKYRGSLENTVQLFKNVKQLDFIKDDIQQLVFSEQLPKKSYRIMEVSKSMLQDFKNGQKLTFRGGQEDYCVVCTEDKTFDVKEVDMSNSLFVVPTLTDGQGMTIDGEKQIHEREIVMMTHNYFELKEIDCVSVYKLRELLHETELVWKWEKGDCGGKNYDFRDTFIEKIIDAADDKEADGIGIEEVTFEALRRYLPAQATESAIRWFLRTFCELVQAENLVYKMLPRPLVRSRASYILRNVSGLETETFERHLDQMLPAGIELKYTYLDGISVITENFKGRTISYLNVEDLPENPRERLQILFERKPSWTMDEVAPYLQDICVSAKAMSSLMVGHCRASKNQEGEKWKTVKRASVEGPFGLPAISVWSRLIYMCTCRRRKESSSHQHEEEIDDATTRISMKMTEGGGLKGGASCQHRAKKGLFKPKEARAALKKAKKVCEECDRMAAKNQPVPETSSNEIVMCITCGRLSCEAHGRSHCENRSGTSEHPFIFLLEKGVLRCHPCDVDLEPLEDPSDHVRQFYNDYNSFNKNREKAEEKKREKTNGTVAAENDPIEKPRVEGNPQEVGVSMVTVKLEKEEKNERKKENGPTTRAGASSRAVAATMTGFEEIETRIPVKGLSNLGNTCFYNSVMQCIMHTHHLDFYFRRFGRVRQLDFEETRTVTLGEEKIELEPAAMPVPEEDSPLNDVVRGFLAEFRHGQSPSPGSVFSQISKKAPRFKGWQQQDAHELLRYLLDGLRSEEQERYKSAIAAHLGVPKDKRGKNTDPAVVKRAKGYLQAAGRPLLDAVFGGTLLQTIRCCECNHVSQAMEQFLDLSVPMSANPMAARLAAGKQVPSAHQKKKAEKATKKANRQQARKQQQAAQTKKANGGLKEGVEELQLKEEEESGPETEESETEEDLDELDEEEENSRLDGGASKADRLAMTKVLVEPPKQYSEGRNVGGCLLEFTAEELLAGTNSYECEECCQPRNKKLGAKGAEKKRVEAIKRYLIYEPPAILTLQLKRFQQVAGYGGRLQTRKLGGHVDFPCLFDIAPFCCRNVQRVQPSQRGIFYSLYGVVVHSGDLSGGHYIAYVKSRHRVPHAQEFLEAARTSCVDGAADRLKRNGESPSTTGGGTESAPSSPDGQWYYCSDSHVNAVQESRVLAAEAYILFYERVS